MNEETGKAVVSLLDFDDEALLDQIAMRSTVVRTQPSVAGQLDTDVSVEMKHLGVFEDLQELGRRIFKRIERELYGVLCGSSTEDQKDRESILGATGLGDAAIGAALVAVMTGTLGLAPLVATAVAALLIKRIFKPAGATFCEFWKEKLG